MVNLKFFPGFYSVKPLNEDTLYPMAKISYIAKKHVYEEVLSTHEVYREFPQAEHPI
jgi:hypothetical protein